MSLRRWLVGPALACGLVAAHAADIELVFKDAGGRPIEDAVAWLEPATVDAAPRPARASVRQRDREFIPTVTIVPLGSSIDFPNDDPMLHHVYSFSAPKTFEIKLYKGKPAAPVVFDKPGVVAIGCNIHDWMEAFIVVVPTRFAGLSPADGRIVLRDLPADRWTLHVWHPRQKLDQPVQIVDLAAADHRRVPVAIDLKPREAKLKPAETTY